MPHVNIYANINTARTVKAKNQWLNIYFNLDQSIAHNLHKASLSLTWKMRLLMHR